jgi:hypothetical protein
MDRCPYCAKVISPDDPDRMTIMQGAVVVHGTCFKRAIEDVKNRVHLSVVPGSVHKTES